MRKLFIYNVKFDNSLKVNHNYFFFLIKFQVQFAHSDFDIQQTDSNKIGASKQQLL